MQCSLHVDYGKVNVSTELHRTSTKVDIFIKSEEWKSEVLRVSGYVILEGLHGGSTQNEACGDTMETISKEKEHGSEKSRLLNVSLLVVTDFELSAQYAPKR